MPATQTSMDIIGDWAAVLSPTPSSRLKAVEGLLKMEVKSLSQKAQPEDRADYSMLCLKTCYGQIASLQQQKQGPGSSPMADHQDLM